MAKVKTSKWVEIIAPKIFNEVSMGHMVYSDPKTIAGRRVNVNLSGLIGDFSKQHMTLSFKIKGLSENKAVTEVEAFGVQKQYIMRRVRRRSTKIESVDDVELKDKMKVRVKSVCITAFTCQDKQRKALKAKISETIAKLCSEYNFEALILALCSEKVKNTVHSKLNKTYPVRYFEVHMVKPRA